MGIAKLKFTLLMGHEHTYLQNMSSITSINTGAEGTKIGDITTPGTPKAFVIKKEDLPGLLQKIKGTPLETKLGSMLGVNTGDMGTNIGELVGPI